MVRRRDGRGEEATELYKQAAQQSPDHCFPNKIDEVLILKKAIALNPSDAKARYYLGNFLVRQTAISEASPAGKRLYI